jgi:hypothetical protein
MTMTRAEMAAAGVVATQVHGGVRIIALRRAPVNALTLPLASQRSGFSAAEPAALPGVQPSTQRSVRLEFLELRAER